MQYITLWLHVSTENGHHQANKEHSVKVQKGSTEWDPISFTVECKIICKKNSNLQLKQLKLSSKHNRRKSSKCHVVVSLNQQSI